MKDTEIDERAVGIVTVGVEGLMDRLRFAVHIIFRGEATFGILPENFVEVGKRPVDTTCIYLVDEPPEHGSGE